MKNLLLAFFVLLAGRPGYAQVISGKVVNDKNEVIVGSSVFISNTSIGTTSNKDGYFELTNIPPGKYDLIISSIGYETNVYSFATTQLPLRLKVVMEIKVRELDNVILEPSVEESWERWGKLFTDYFIGSTPNGINCKISNYRSIHFRYYKRSNRLVAYCDEPLHIENKSLGYHLNYQLENFEVDFKEHTSAFAGFPFFEEIDKSRRGLQNKWQSRRDKAYHGSMLHFFRSLISNQVKEEGFEVRRMKRIPNLEKERIKAIYKLVGLSVLKDSLQTRRIADSADYYQRILRQDDYTDIASPHLLTSDSIIINRQKEDCLIFFPDYLHITYKKEIEDPSYLAFYRENRKPAFQTSIIWLTIPEAVLIDSNGSYYPPQGIFSMAYWGWSEKIADMLPLDFRPEN